MPCMPLSTSVKMIELHYGHINPALKAEEIAGKRHAPRVTDADIASAVRQRKNTVKLKVVK